MRSLPLVLCALVGCGGIAVVESDDDAAATAAGSGGSTATTSSASSTSASAGGGSCPGWTEERVALRMSDPGGIEWGCDAELPSLGTLEFDGVVIDAGPAHVEINLCVLEPCFYPYRFELSAPGLRLSDPYGALVHAAIFTGFEADGRCTHGLEIHNLPSLGVFNTVEPRDLLWLAVGDGAHTPWNTVIAMDPEPLGCSSAPAPEPCATDLALRFRNAELPDDPGVLLRMGETAEDFAVDPAEATIQHFDVRNLRSFRSSCDETSDEWGYFIVQRL